jgi:methyl-accepting chemotaxis protein
MQAGGDSLLLSTLESMGLDTSAIRQRAGMDKTECLDQVKNAIHMLREQCAALAGSRLNDKIFDEPMACAGAFGKAFGQIRENFRVSLEQISRSSTELANSAEQLTSVSQQMAAVAEETAVQSKVVTNASSTVSERVSAVATSASEMQRHGIDAPSDLLGGTRTAIGQFLYVSGDDRK